MHFIFYISLHYFPFLSFHSTFLHSIFTSCFVLVKFHCSILIVCIHCPTRIIVQCGIFYILLSTLHHLHVAYCCGCKGHSLYIRRGVPGDEATHHIYVHIWSTSTKLALTNTIFYRWSNVFPLMKKE